MPDFDVVGIGLNATDTVILVPHFPPYAGKVAFDEEMMSPGGQVASAMVACFISIRIPASGPDPSTNVAPQVAHL